VQVGIIVGLRQLFAGTFLFSVIP